MYLFIDLRWSLFILFVMDYTTKDRLFIKISTSSLLSNIHEGRWRLVIDNVAVLLVVKYIWIYHGLVYDVMVDVGLPTFLVL